MASKNLLLEGDASIFETDLQLCMLPRQFGLQLQFQRLHPVEKVRDNRVHRLGSPVLLTISTRELS
jgi:hypothetical protein